MNLFKRITHFIGKPKETSPRMPRLRRVYSWWDLPKERHNLYWNSSYIHDQPSLERVYKHISTAYEIVYHANTHSVQCSVHTKKYGWCLLNLRYSLWFTEFGIYKSMTRYDIYSVSDVMKYMPLYNFLSSLIKKAYDEYQNDKNL